MALRQTHSQSHAAHGGRIGAAAPQGETSQLQRSYIYVRSNTDRKCTLRLLWRGHRECPQSCSRSHSVRAGSVTAVRIPLCGDTCAQMRKASCSVRPCRLAVKNVPSYAAPRSATGVSPVLSTARFALPSPFSAIDWLHTPHGSQARPARFLVGSARSMAYVRAVAVEPQRQKRALMATSPQTSSHSGSI